MATPRRSNRPSAASLVVFVGGLVAAAASGVYTYRTVGLYGGPIATGFHREWDPVTGRYVLIHESVTKDGVKVRRVHNDDVTVRRTEVNARVGDSTLELSRDAGDAPARVGFSIANDGVIDAWATHDAASGETRVEISTKRDGRIDRWERYLGKSLVRVDLDTNGNGKADRWMTYQDGILTQTVVDANEDGQPDRVP